VTMDGTNQEEWKVGFVSVIEGETIQEDWSAIVVERQSHLQCGR
jgi:hypothetical protein